VLNNQKAVVFYSSRVNCPDNSFGSSASIVAEKDAKEELVLASDVAVKPGKYLLLGLSWTKSTSSAIQTRTYYVNRPFDLQIKGGQVLYLGDIKSYSDGRDAARLCLEDNFSKTYDMVSKKYPQLIGRLEKKLLTYNNLN